MKKDWELLNRESLVKTPVFNLRRDRKLRTASNLTWDFYILESGDWVNVIPTTPAGDVILVEITRHGINERSLEIPGGLIDPEDPSPTAAAARELLEETGFEAEIVLPLGVLHPNPAIQGNRCYTFLAQNARKVADPTHDPAEDIAIVTAPLGSIPDLIRAGRITHALVISAFLWLELGEPGALGLARPERS